MANRILFWILFRIVANNSSGQPRAVILQPVLVRLHIEIAVMKSRFLRRFIERQTLVAHGHNQFLQHRLAVAAVPRNELLRCEVGQVVRRGLAHAPFFPGFFHQRVVVFYVEQLFDDFILGFTRQFKPGLAEIFLL